MISIDATGLVCPAPMVKTRQAIDALPPHGGQIQILVDNQMAAENLERMSRAAGYGYLCTDRGGGRYGIAITVGTHTPETTDQPGIPLPHGEGGLTVAIGRASMGQGSEALGEILIKGFLYTLSQLDMPPRSLLFFNGGVKLVLSDSNALVDLQALADKGTQILICGTCVDYYDIRDRLGVGEIANMLEIVQEMARAQRLIQL
ncbi:MAG: sulfurtransferase-like selenium metabolism protein YedF [Oscillospiraceae bacterium]|nr:sulfurtransferase-like selenium metabolism protein YedF [Oscillospiraceae bacterium]